jgi:hypothetical protein
VAPGAQRRWYTSTRDAGSAISCNCHDAAGIARGRRLAVADSRLHQQGFVSSTTSVRAPAKPIIRTNGFVASCPARIATIRSISDHAKTSCLPSNFAEMPRSSTSTRAPGGCQCTRFASTDNSRSISPMATPRCGGPLLHSPEPYPTSSRPKFPARPFSITRHCGPGSLWLVCRAPSRDVRAGPFGSGSAGQDGWVAEWFKAAVLKTAEGVSLPWVRIPPHPPGRSPAHSLGPPHLGSKTLHAICSALRGHIVGWTSHLVAGLGCSVSC